MGRVVKVLLVVGKGETWADDMARFRRFDVPHDVMGVNHAALWLDPAPKYAFSYHPTVMGEVKKARPSVETFSIVSSEGVDRENRGLRRLGGSSSLLAAVQGLQLGYPRVVLAGVPLNGRYFFDFIRQWISEFPRLEGRVKSMSGATWAMLGGPTAEWLAGEGA